jgi:hypothetical protein
MTKFALETLESRRLLSASGVTAAVLNEEYKLQPSTPPILYVVTDPIPSPSARTPLALSAR